ncbi:hypothetical protein CEUSTIGMA_g2985.t1 [Chlamydomonas eustigma]|uniref:Pseudouridine synthase RsuA/RluA-like domain-containing protein n=1 Tax=Chlamydomonas eustigma TaxID=1157962 RepID=A0A250WY64_9CHLO|nr:hypothetical protein CEUSTIGMA_g2985.t1 [Chlamydomonas eustigma]|eukprot:GAX75542.1 hypothetical protein CEUSTIGMA_g2985.t1 [Chlamydomonas eustigma]
MKISIDPCLLLWRRFLHQQQPGPLERFKELFFTHKVPGSALRPISSRFEYGRADTSKESITTNLNTALSDSVKKLLLSNAMTPPVRLMAGLQPPSALSLLRRRGPDNVHPGLLFKLFRKGAIRVFRPSTGKVSKISRHYVMQAGERVLYPPELDDNLRGSQLEGQMGHYVIGDNNGSKQASLPPAETGSAAMTVIVNAQLGQQLGPYPSAGPTLKKPEVKPKKTLLVVHKSHQPEAAVSMAPRLTTQEQVSARISAQSLSGRSTHEDGDNAWTRKGLNRDPGVIPLESQIGFKNPREWILKHNDDILFINKPAGVSMQGPHKDSIEALFHGPLKLHKNDDLKLVHRLDTCVSGVVMVARNADSAAQLAACFRNRTRKALQLLEDQYLIQQQGASLPDQPSTSASTLKDSHSSLSLSVERIYWALVQGKLMPGSKGTITLSVADSLDRGSGRKQALTSYRVLAQKNGFSWVELVPSTGRRHQLRYHCYKGLKAPIIGDNAYGFRGKLPVSKDDRGGDVLTTDRPPHDAERMHSYKEQPVMLHSREMILRLPDQRPLRVIAPLPQHFVNVIHSIGFNLPTE